MKRAIGSFQLIFGLNTLFAIIVSLASTMISIDKNWTMDFPLTIVGIAVVFPIVFSIGGAYTRREAALTQYANLKGLGRAMYFASRDWLRDKGKRANKNKLNFKNDLVKLFSTVRQLFQTHDVKKREELERKIYVLFSKLSKDAEDLRDRGLSGSEVSRVNSHLSRMLTSFESIKHIHQYRTPRTLRSYSKIFIFLIPVIYAPYFAHLAEGKPLFLGLLMPVFFAIIFTSLDNIQDHLENPFDQIGEDDIKINAEKFSKTIDL